MQTNVPSQTTAFWLFLFLAVFIFYGATEVRAQETGLQDLQENLERSLDQEHQGDMTANLDDVRLKDFIMFVSRFTDRNIVFREDQIPPSRISMQTSTALKEPELLAVFKTILKSNNLELVSRGDMLYILQAPVVRDMTDSFVHPIPAGQEQEVLTTVIQLEPRVPLEQAVELLQPFLSHHGLIRPIAPARSILLRDSRQKLNQIAEIVKNLQELGPQWQTEMIELEKVEVREAAQKITEFYQGLIDRGQMGEMPVLLPVQWSNALMVAGARDQIDTVQGLVHNLDQITDRDTGLKIYPLKNAKAESAAEVLRQLLADEDVLQELPGEDSNLVVAPDQETNSILVLAAPQFLPQVDEIIEHLDQPLAQVYVEALIVETTLEHSQEFGVQWLAGGGSSDGIVTGGFVAPDSRLGPLLTEAAPPVAPQGFSVGALGNTVTYSGKQFSTLGALVNFLKTARDFNILSTPQIMTLDNTEAEVFIGENRPFVVSERIDPQGNIIQSFDYRDVGIRLLVTPSINTESDMIRLEVEQEVKNVIAQIDNRAPTTMNRNTKTSVQLPSGSTMVISGLIESSYAHTRRSVPGASQLPGLGWLTRQEEISAPKTNLMVFLSARIIDSLEQADDLTTERMDKMHEVREAHEEILEQEFWGRSKRQKEVFGLDMPELDRSGPEPEPVKHSHD